MDLAQDVPVLLQSGLIGVYPRWVVLVGLSLLLLIFPDFSPHRLEFLVAELAVLIVFVSKLLDIFEEFLDMLLANAEPVVHLWPIIGLCEDVEQLLEREHPFLIPLFLQLGELLSI